MEIVCVMWVIYKLVVLMMIEGVLYVLFGMVVMFGIYYGLFKVFCVWLLVWCCVRIVLYVV